VRALLLRWLLNAIGLWALIGLISTAIPGAITAHGILPPFLVVVVLSLLNSFLRPLLKLLTLPLNCLTFGIVGTIINLLLFYLAFRLTPGFEIEWSVRTFLSLYLGMTLISIVVSHVIRKADS
jgi:putative membrane protein